MGSIRKIYIPFRRQRGFAECRKRKGYPPRVSRRRGFPDGGGRPEGAGFHGAERRGKAGHPLEGARRGPCDLVVLRLGLHECAPRAALRDARLDGRPSEVGRKGVRDQYGQPPQPSGRSEEHTSELQSRPHLVCRLLLEKKKYSNTTDTTQHDEDSSTSGGSV